MVAQPTEHLADVTSTRKDRSSSSWKGKRVGRFRLIELLGRGGMGVVIRAEDTTLKRQVALKILPRQVERGEHTYRLEQFLREARSAASLDHPHVVHVYEVGEIEGWYYIAMELLEGGNLQEVVQATGPMDAVRVAQLGADVADALYHAHKLGIIHRDLKPTNLMLARNGRVKLTDFGLARWDDPNDPFTLPTEGVGTPLYASPEALAHKPANEQSDIYSLAATLWFLLTGKPPYHSSDLKKLRAMVEGSPLPRARDFGVSIPPALVETLHQGLAKKPEDRFANADYFAKKLRLQAIPMDSSGFNQTSSIPANSLRLRPKKQAGYSPILWVSLAVGGVLLGAGIVTGVMVLNQAKLAPESSAEKLITAQAAPPAAPLPPPDPEQLYGRVERQSVPPHPAKAINTTPAPSTANPSPVVAPSTSSPRVNQPLGIDWSTIPAVQILTPDQRDELIRLATEKPLEIYAIQGRVAAVTTSRTGRVANIRFENVSGGNGFSGVFFPSIFPTMTATFGGTNGAALKGKTILLKGQLNLYRGNPQIIVDHVSQIQVVE